MYRDVLRLVAQEHPAVDYGHCYADALCARLVREPQNFVVVSENLLADLLSDLVGQIAGG